MTELLIASNFLLFSVILNILFFIKIKKLKKHPPPQLTTSAQELLGAIATGKALLHVEVLDPGSIFLRSPR